MTLESWRENGWIETFSCSDDEIAALLDLASKDIRQTSISGLSTDWQFKIAYEAILSCARAALYQSGYRVSRTGGHYHEIMSLQLTVELNSDTLDLLNRFRMRRNQAAYEGEGIASTWEAGEIVVLAGKWLTRRSGSWKINALLVQSKLYCNTFKKYGRFLPEIIVS